MTELRIHSMLTIRSVEPARSAAASPRAGRAQAHRSPVPVRDAAHRSAEVGHWGPLARRQPHKRRSKRFQCLTSISGSFAGRMAQESTIQNQ